MLSSYHESHVWRLDEVGFESAESDEEDVDDRVVDGVVVGVVDVAVLVVVVPSWKRSCLNNISIASNFNYLAFQANNLAHSSNFLVLVNVRLEDNFFWFLVNRWFRCKALQGPQAQASVGTLKPALTLNSLNFRSKKISFYLYHVFKKAIQWAY